MGGWVESKKKYLASTSHFKKNRAKRNREKNIEQDFPVVLIVIYGINQVTCLKFDVKAIYGHRRKRAECGKIQNKNPCTYKY